MWGRRGSLGLGTRVGMGEWGPPGHPFRALACVRPRKCCGRGETVFRAQATSDVIYQSQPTDAPGCLWGRISAQEERQGLGRGSEG